MATTWDVKVTDLRHRRAINDNSLDLQLTVTKLVDNVPATWNPWTSPVTVKQDAKIPVPGDRVGDYDAAPWASELGRSGRESSASRHRQGHEAAPF